jgi:hypothetical protein
MRLLDVERLRLRDLESVDRDRECVFSEGVVSGLGSIMEVVAL